MLDKLHELEKKYYSPNSEEWWTKFKNIDVKDIANALVPHETIEVSMKVFEQENPIN